MSTTIKKENINKKHYDAMLIAVMPLIVASAIMYGARVILLSAIAMITARVIDVLATMIFKMELDTADKSSVVAALVFTLMLPVSIPIYIVVVTIIVTIFIGKYAFGGSGAYPFSLPALAICLAAVNWPSEVFKVVEPFSEVSFFSGASLEFSTHTTVIKQGGLPNVAFIDLILGNYASSMGTSFVLIIVAVGIYLITTKRISFQIPFCFLLSYSIFALIFPRIYGISIIDNLTLEVLTSGCIFYAFFVVSEPALTPKGKNAQIIYGVLAGVLGVLFTYFGEFEIGVCFAILILNAMQRSIEEGALMLELFMSNKKSKPKNIKAKTVVPADSKKDEPKEEKPIEEKPQKTQKEIIEENLSPIELIKKAEDDIDEVIFSTQTFSMQELLDETRKAKAKKTVVEEKPKKESDKKPPQKKKRSKNNKNNKKPPQNKPQNKKNENEKNDTSN